VTIDERLDRIEHVTAGLDEERRRDREENRQLWRDTQRQLNEVATRMSDLTVKIADTNDTITRFAEESRAADRQLGERIDALVSAIGKMLSK